MKKVTKKWKCFVYYSCFKILILIYYLMQVINLMIYIMSLRAFTLDSIYENPNTQLNT